MDGVRLTCVAALALTTCTRDDWSPPQGLPAGRIVALQSKDLETRFVWIADTASRHALEPLALDDPLTWPHGGTAGMASDLSYAKGRDLFLFSGLLPIGDQAAHLTCRPFVLSTKGTIAVYDGVRKGREPGGGCGYRWFGDEVVYVEDRTVWAEPAAGPARVITTYGKERTPDYDFHDGGGLVVEDVYEAPVKILSPAGEPIAEIDVRSARIACVDHTGTRVALWDPDAGASIWTVKDGAATQEEPRLPVAELRDGDREEWHACAFSPDGAWIAFKSNRHFGNRTNPLAGVKNARLGLHAWELATGRVVRMVKDEVHLVGLVWAPPAS